MTHYETTTLSNGLRLACESDSQALTAAFAVAVDVGARYETAQEAGLSHLLEHMAFKGTSRMSARAIAEAFDLMGGNVNAYTSHEHTVYYAKVLREYADEALALLLEIVADSVFDPHELEREREVVLQEIAMHRDSPDDLVFDLFQEQCFAAQALGRPILGTPERVLAYRREDLQAFTAKHYAPARMVIAAAGAVDLPLLVRRAEEFLGARPGADREAGFTPARFSGGEATHEKDLEQVQLVLGFAGLPRTHADHYAVQLFTTILGGGMSSRLFQEIREKRGLAYAVSAFAASYQDVGVIGLYAGTTTQHLDTLISGLREVLSDMQRGVSDAELLRAKNQIKASIVMSQESTGTIAEWIARHLLVYGHYRPARQVLEAVARISAQDVARVGQLVLSTPQPVIAALGPPGSVSAAGLAARLAS